MVLLNSIKVKCEGHGSRGLSYHSLLTGSSSKKKPLDGKSAKLYLPVAEEVICVTLF